MAIGLKQFLLLILLAGFALAALTNSERPFMIELVKLITIGALVVMAYGVWAFLGEKRAYCAGFLLWGGFYYVAYIVLESRRVDLGTDTLILWLGRRLETGRIMWAVYEKIGHLLISLLLGLIGGWVTVFFYRIRRRFRQPSSD
jgi:hypothetical protein